MKTFEFYSPVGPGGTLTLPPDVASQVPADMPVHVSLVIPDEDRLEELAFMEAGLRDAFGEEDPGDALYNDPEPR